MKYVIWFLPIELVPQVATLLIMLGGLALVFGQKALAVSSFLSAGALLITPLFDPMIDTTVDVTMDVGETFLRQAPWWLIAGTLAITLLLLLRAILAAIFGKQTADYTVGILIADAIRAVFRILILGPFRLVIALVRMLIP